jgi:hypothetical protein
MNTNSEMTNKENRNRKTKLNFEEMRQITGGAELSQKPKTTGEVIILPFRQN